MKAWYELEPARALPMVLALLLIYALASFAAGRSFAELAPAVPFAGGASSPDGPAHHTVRERAVVGG
jgi:hypothetical protein